MAKHQKVNRSEVRRQLLAGLREADIARTFRVSRERIRQLNEEFGLRPSRIERRKAALAMVEPFMPLLGKRRKCLLCKSVDAEGNNSFCAGCARIRWALAALFASVRDWRRKKDKQCLWRAVSLIRRFKLTPEDAREFYLFTGGGGDAP